MKDVIYIGYEESTKRIIVANTIGSGNRKSVIYILYDTRGNLISVIT